MKRQKGSRLIRLFVNKKRIKGSGVTRPFINKRNRLMLGNGKRKRIRKQKGGFFGPILKMLF